MKVQILIFFYVILLLNRFAEAQTTAIGKPSVCSRIAPVFALGNYMKSLCYVKAKSTYNKAQALCLKNGMKLYQAKLPAEVSAISAFTKKYFGQSKLATAFVDGKNGTKCKTFNGAGKLSDDWCKITYTFFCEFKDNDPLSGVEKAFTASYKDLFVAALNGKNTSAAIENILQVISSFSLIPKEERSFITSLFTSISSYKANPTETEKAESEKAFQTYLAEHKKTITSQPGLENVLTDPVLMSKPENREFYQQFEELDSYYTTLKANPGSLYLLFTNEAEKVAAKYARYSYVTQVFLMNNGISQQLKLVFKGLLTLSATEFTTAKSSFKTFLQRLKANTAQVDNYINALEKFSLTVVKNPTPAEQTAANVKREQFLSATMTLIESFTGLANFKTDSFFTSNPLNGDFLKLIEFFEFFKTGATKNENFPNYDIFNAESYQNLFSQLIAQAIVVSNRIKSEN